MPPAKVNVWPKVTRLGISGGGVLLVVTDPSAPRITILNCPISIFEFTSYSITPEGCCACAAAPITRPADSKTNVFMAFSVKMTRRDGEKG